MSLINEALRKAQNQRTQTSELGSDSVKPPLNHTGRPKQLVLTIVLSVCIVILIGLVAGLTITLLNKYTSQAIQQSMPEESGTSTAEPATQTFVSEPVTESVKTESDQTKPEIAVQLSEKVEKPVTAEPNREIMDWVAQSKVTGVRITSSESKVILNNRAFVPSDSVETSLGLKVLEIEANRIIFVDSNNVRYVKLF